MYSSKIVFLSILFILPIVAKRRWKCEPVICPPCQWNFTDTFEQSALRYLTGEIPSPEDGSCETGVKWTNYGADYGFTRNTCCCFTEYASITPCTATNNVQCIQSPPIAYSETFAHYYERIGKSIKKG